MTKAKKERDLEIKQVIVVLYGNSSISICLHCHLDMTVFKTDTLLRLHDFTTLKGWQYAKWKSVWDKTGGNVSNAGKGRLKGRTSIDPHILHPVVLRPYMDFFLSLTLEKKIKRSNFMSSHISKGLIDDWSRTIMVFCSEQHLYRETVKRKMSPLVKCHHHDICSLLTFLHSYMTDSHFECQKAHRIWWGSGTAGGLIWSSSRQPQFNPYHHHRRHHPSSSASQFHLSSSEQGN